MKNVINLKRAAKKQEKKIASKKFIEAWRQSIITDLRMKFGNDVVEKYWGFVREQLDTCEIDLFEKSNGKKAHKDSKSKQRSSVTSISKADSKKNDRGSIQTGEEKV